jgi:Uma2 family endonuclease
MSTALRITYEQYDVMVRAGAFDGKHRQRVELIRGEIVPISPIGAIHEILVDELMEWSVLNVPRDRVRVRVQNSIGLPELESVPEPDVAWVARRDYRTQRPQAEDVYLIIEVADSSLRNDLGEKADLYAEAGIRDYWVVDANHQRLVVLRNPVNGRYASRVELEGAVTVRPIAFPEIELSVAELFAVQDG